MATFPLTFLDVFTDVALAGNGLAVVSDADALDDETMLRFAHETRLSETTFVQAATEAGADYRVRFWTMAGEIAFAGHPSLGTAVAVARARGESAAAYTQQTAAGLQPVEVEVDGDRARASMLQEPAQFGPEIAPERALGAVSLPVSLGVPDLPPQVVGTGVPQLIVPVLPEALAAAAPRGEAAHSLLTELGCVVIYLVAGDLSSGTVRARSFMRAPDGVSEDPATGAAVGPLCAYLQRRTGCAKVVVSQGVEMGRPSVLEAELAGDRVRVSGSVVVVVDATLRL